MENFWRSLWAGFTGISLIFFCIIIYYCNYKDITGRNHTKTSELIIDLVSTGNVYIYRSEDMSGDYFCHGDSADTSVNAFFIILRSDTLINCADYCVLIKKITPGAITCDIRYKLRP